MQNVYKEVNTLDKRCISEFGLNSDILMENAAQKIAQGVLIKFLDIIDPRVLILTGPGDNGADGITLARILHTKCTLDLYPALSPKSKMAKKQLKRTKKIGINPLKKEPNLNQYDIIIDCIFGSGLNRSMPSSAIELINKTNSTKAYKIACDIPSGIDIYGNIPDTAFIAHSTITMGAMKLSLLSDIAKDYVGDITVAELGIAQKTYERSSNIKLLTHSDIKLPTRKIQNVHKGSFGFVGVYGGSGASVLCAKASLNIGAGKCSIINPQKSYLPEYIMQHSSIHPSMNAVCAGMGLGFEFDITLLQDIDIPMVIDADLFYYKDIETILNKKNIILTPHPKEFASLLTILGFKEYDTEYIQANKITLIEQFVHKYPNITLLLKGANTIIAQNDKIYINNLGSSKLSFGGSGDILAGVIAGLLAQGYNSLQATIHSSLIHAISANQSLVNDYAFGSDELLQNIKTLKI